MKKITLIFSALLLFVATSVNAAHLSEKLLITTKLTGAQEVPAVNTTATGVASFHLNQTKDTMCIDIVAIGLSGPITGIHVHEGATGTNGGVVLNLSAFISGNRISTMITGSDLTAENIEKYLSGMYYLNVHTAANPNGEIRGQLKLETDKGYRASMDAAQQTHTVTSSATGLASFSVSLAGEKMEIKVVATDLSGTITAAHLHYGASGIAGGVAVNLSSMISGNTIVGTADISGNATLMDSLKAGNVYINIHTAANPNGEIRGQLSTNSNLYFDGMMDINQEPHAVVNSMAMGLVIVEVSPDLENVMTYSLIDGISGAITSAHLHTGAVGVSGNVALNVSTGIAGSAITSTNTINITNTVDLGILNAMLTGGIYLNVHTALNAAGEVRGQLTRIIREGYTINLDGEQEVPAVSGSAQGMGIVSIDRGRSNAHYMVVLEGLSGNITGAHFHNAAAGANGGVVYNMSAGFTQSATFDGAFGYWTDLDANTAFMNTNEVMFRNDEIYVNIHTAANANGEIRGQVRRDADCMNSLTNTVSQSIFNNVAISPNPVSDNLTLNVELDEAFEGNIIITNTVGQTMMQQTISQKADLSNYQIDVNTLPKGLYFITIANNDYRYTMRFVKN